MHPPPDRGHIATETSNKRSLAMDAMSVQQCVQLMADDHREVVEAVQRAVAELARLIEALVVRMRENGRLVYLGAGTSGRLGVLDASECPPTFQSEPGTVVGVIAGGDPALRSSSEAMEDDPAGAKEALKAIDLNQRDTVLGIAAGGTTPYVLGGIELARSCGAMTGLLTCSPREAPPHCDHLIVLDTGPELLTGSTRLKAGSATKLALNIITTTTFTQLGKVYSNLMVDLRATNDKLTDRAIRLLIHFCPELTRSHAANALENANRDLKTAIVMQQHKVSLDAAQAKLAEHQGRLRPILDETPQS